MSFIDYFLSSLFASLCFLNFLFGSIIDYFKHYFGSRYQVAQDQQMRMIHRENAIQEYSTFSFSAVICFPDWLENYYLISKM
jgi:hypothetical protein